MHDGCPISIHAPRTGSDGGVPERHRAPLNFNPRSPHGERPPPDEGWKRNQPFQSTLPARGATGGFYHRHRRHDISIHAPRTGSDILTFVAHAQ